MANRRQTIIRAGLETLYFSGIHHVARQFLSGAGAILTFHRVRPALPDPFQPNRILEITPEFLDEVLTRLAQSGIEIVTMDEVHRRLIDGKATRRFVALTFDDGYRDNRQYALPILARHNAPFTLFLPSDFAEGTGELWWVALERAIAGNDQVEVVIDEIAQVFDCATAEAKQIAFDTIYAQIRSAPTEEELRAPVRALAAACGLDMHGICRELCMGWDEIATFAAHPLVTIGGHTVTHAMLAKLNEAEARREMVEGARTIAARLGHMPAHFSYPVGAPATPGWL